MTSNDCCSRAVRLSVCRHEEICQLRYRQSREHEGSELACASETCVINSVRETSLWMLRNSITNTAIAQYK